MSGANPPAGFEPPAAVPPPPPSAAPPPMPDPGPLGEGTTTPSGRKGITIDALDVAKAMGTAVRVVEKPMAAAIWLVLPGIVVFAIGGGLLFRHSVIGLAIVLVLAVIGVLPALWLGHQARRMRKAAEPPEALATDIATLTRHTLTDQSVTDIRSELGSLRQLGSQKRGRLRGVAKAMWHLGRATTRLIQAADPDEVAPRLSPFKPERLTNSWTAAIFTAWTAVVAPIIGTFAAIIAIVVAL